MDGRVMIDGGEGLMCDGRCRPDVDVITANPKTAGVARWNFFALWGHRLDKGEDAALDYTTKARPLHPPPALHVP